MDPHLVQNLRALVEKYHSIDAELKALRLQSLDLRKAKQDLSAQIMMIMTDSGLEDVRFQNRTLRYSVRKVTKFPTRKEIEDRLLPIVSKLTSEPKEQFALQQSVLAPRIEEKPGIRKITVSNKPRNEQRRSD